MLAAANHDSVFANHVTTTTLTESSATSHQSFCRKLTFTVSSVIKATTAFYQVKLLLASRRVFVLAKKFDPQLHW
jgi:hypothetical protein